MKPLSPKDRELQIELLRTRAALERQTLQHSVRQLGRSLAPGQLFNQLGQQVSPRSLASLGLQALTLTRRYPFLFSAVSAGVSLVGRKSRWVGLAAGLAMGWQLLRNRRN